MKKLPESDANFSRLVANNLSVDNSSICEAGSIHLFTEELCAGRLVAPGAKFAKLILFLEDMASDDELMTDVCRCAQELDRQDGGFRVDSLRTEVVNAWIDSADSLVRNSNVLEEYLDEDEFWDARDRVADFAREKFHDMDLFISDKEVEDFVEAVDIQDIISDNLGSYVTDDYGRDERIAEVINPDLEIIEYFDRSGY